MQPTSQMCSVRKR